jgi:hypothetical protein
MKKEQLKSILKPLIKECIKEVMFEDGVLSGIISEVARGVGGIQTVEAGPAATQERQDPGIARMQRNAFSAEQSNKLQEHKKKLMSAIGAQTFNGVDLFEGTTPAPAGPSPGASAAPQGALSGVAPSDPGVDITGLFGAVGRNWGAHMKAGK